MDNATSFFIFGIIGLAYWPTMLWLLFNRTSYGKPISRTNLILLQISIIGALATVLIPKTFPWLLIAPVYVFDISIHAIQNYWKFFEPFIGLSFAIAFFMLAKINKKDIKMILK